MSPHFRVDRMLFAVAVLTWADLAMSQPTVEKHTAYVQDCCYSVNKRLDDIVEKIETIFSIMRREKQGESCSNAQPQSFALISGEKYSVPDSALTSSGHYEQYANLYHGPDCSRLGQPKPERCFSHSWSADPDQSEIWIQVDLGSSCVVDGIATKGRINWSSPQYVTSFKLAAINADDISYYSGGDSGNAKVFSGNADKTTVVQHILQPTMCGKKIRLYVLTYVNHPSMVWEVYGYPLFTTL